VLVMTGALLWWAVAKADGLGPLLAQPGQVPDLREFWPVFVPSLTAMIGFWATLSLNMPDFTRFGRSQREQIIGQVVALPTTMSLFAAMGVMITSATAIIYGQAIWDPGAAGRQIQLTDRRRHLHVHRRRRDDRRQHRGERRVAGQ
jgi:NCS1 family nucleobase:cation symporter-1